MKLTIQERIDIAVARRPEFHGVAQVTVAHDDWCSRLLGGTCNCIPDMEMTFEGERFGIDALGNFTIVSSH